jgi:hypothetical protein
MERQRQPKPENQVNQVANLNPGLQAANAARAKKKADREAAKAAGSAKARNTLTIVERVKLGNLVNAEYASSGLTDAEFAKLATERLGRDVVTSTITAFREAFGLTAPQALTLTTARARIRELEAELAALKAQ